MENFIKVQLRDGDSNCGECVALWQPAWLQVAVLQGQVLEADEQAELSDWRGLFSLHTY